MIEDPQLCVSSEFFSENHQRKLDLSRSTEQLVLSEMSKGLRFDDSTCNFVFDSEMLAYECLKLIKNETIPEPIGMSNFYLR